VHRPNSRRLLSRLTLTLTYDIIFIGGRGIVMNSLLPSLVILVSAIFVLSCGQSCDRYRASRDYLSRAMNSDAWNSHILVICPIAIP